MICYHDTKKATQFLFENYCKSKQIKAAPGEKNQHSHRTSRKFLETSGVYIFLIPEGFDKLFPGHRFS